MKKIKSTFSSFKPEHYTLHIDFGFKSKLNNSDTKTTCGVCGDEIVFEQKN